MTDLRQCTDESAHGQHEWYEDNTFRRQCTGFVGRAGVPLGPEPPSRDWGDWAPGKGWERMQAEHPGMVPDLTEEDLRAADEIIARANAGLLDALAERSDTEAGLLDVKRRVALDPEIRKVIFDGLRANLGSLAGREVYRPLVGERYKVHTPEQVVAWLNEQEQGLIEKEERRG